jgi:succinate-semialdehyde dehydrogenase/glutarate-semialdehyde dehydrogenase
MAKFDYKFKNYINGRLVEGNGPEYSVYNSATNELLATNHGVNEAELQEALESAKTAFKTWSRYSLNERITWMKKLLDALRAKEELFIDLLANEVGKNFVEAKTDFNGLFTSMNFYAEEAKRIYGTNVTDWDSKRADVYHMMELRPRGVHVSHLSWNWPIQSIGHKLSPTLASGCTCILKPSIQTPLSGMLLGEVAAGIDFPKGVINIVTGKSSVIGRVLNGSTIPAIVSCIGSNETGRTIMSQSATSMKHFSFELGGNAPAIIFPDAELEQVARTIVERKTQNCGQGCATINRIFVHESVHDEFVGYLVKYMSSREVGWGKETPKAMGPQIDKPTRDATINVIKRAVEQGAKIACGGGIPKNLPAHLKDGAFTEPTVLIDVKNKMDICRIELFAPVLPVLKFGDDLDELLRQCNDTEYGLTGYVFCHDSRKIFKCLEELEVGEVFVNETARGVFLPHVGMKESGLGCTNSKWALDEYYQLRRFTVRV